MSNITEKLFKYGFHDTEISRVEMKDLNIELFFDKGIYNLDDNGKEVALSTPMKITLTIKADYNSLDEVVEIRVLNSRLKEMSLKTFFNKLRKESFEILNIYFSNFNNSILFDGGFSKYQVMFIVEGIDSISIEEL